MDFILVIQIFILSWLARAFKSALFWIYLWQLKEYHFRRFLDHFRTHKGKKTLFNFLSVSKIVLLFMSLLFWEYFFYLFLIILAFYVIELFLFVKNIFMGELKVPRLTAKAVFLVSFSFVLVVFYIYYFKSYLETANWQVFSALLLGFDILSPLIISLVVLVFQPFFVIARNSILKKARQKIRGFKKLTVIAITGSYGKTSTKEFLATILSAKFNVLATKEHRNSEIGIAQTILSDLKKEHQVLIVEMGAYNKGGIKLLCNIVKPQIGVVTGVNEQHLATFGSMENLLSAEGGRELLSQLPKKGLLVVNGDNKYCLDLYKKSEIRKKIYTLKRDRIDSDIWTEDISVEQESVSFIVVTREKEMMHFNVAVLGKQNIENLLGVILVAKELGMELQEISNACQNIRQEQSGATLKIGIKGIDIIDSSYSSNPDGAMANLDYLSIFPNKKVVVMPCLIELGKESSEVHRQIGKKIAEVCNMAIITTKDKFEELKNGAVEGGLNKDKVILCHNPKGILDMIKNFCKTGDTVLLEGRVPRGLIKLLYGK